MNRFSLLAACVLLIPTLAAAAPKMVAEKLTDQPDTWFASDEGKAIVDNIVSWQNAWGGWYKAYDVSAPRPEKLPPPEQVVGVPNNDHDNWASVSTFDNGATHSELRILARAYRVTHDEKYRDAFNKGLAFVFQSQYPNGGWPQRYPLRDNYGRHITYNDNAMVFLMQVLRDVAAGEKDFAFVDTSTRARAKEAFDKGIECILSTQIKADDKLTAWCQQHNEETLAPDFARAYELPSICSFESAYITELLMSLPNPSDRVKAAVNASAAWFDSTKITGKRYDKITETKSVYGVERKLSDDPAAGPLWARFYDIETNKPFFCDRDGVKRWNLEEVGEERRARYAWYNTSGQRVLKDYDAWKQRVGT